MWNIPKCSRFFLFLRFPLENKSGRPKQTNAKGVWPMRTLICQHLRFVVTCRMHSKRGVGGRAYYFVYLRCSYFHPFVFFPQLNVEKKKKKTGLKRRGGRPLFALYRTPISYIFLLSFPFFFFPVVYLSSLKKSAASLICLLNSFFSKQGRRVRILTCYLSACSSSSSLNNNN